MPRPLSILRVFVAKFLTAFAVVISFFGDEDCGIGETSEKKACEIYSNRDQSVSDVANKPSMKTLPAKELYTSYPKRITFLFVQYSCAFRR
jgi:hypothetical protein